MEKINITIQELERALEIFDMAIEETGKIEFQMPISQEKTIANKTVRDISDMIF